MTGRKRTLAVFAAGALVAPFMATGAALAAPADTPLPGVQDVSTFCAEAGDAAFTDSPGGEAGEAINCIAELQITEGGPEGLPASQYGPTLQVSRAQMALFITRMIDAAELLDDEATGVTDLPEYDGQNEFTDLGQTSDEVVGAVNRLADADIVFGGPEGRPTNQYGPTLKVSRAQMASFINRAHEFMTGDDTAVTGDYFSDDETVGAEVESNINDLAEAGIVQGVGGTSYNPSGLVSRAQMALFIARTLADLEEKGFIGPIQPAQNEATVTAGEVEDGAVTITVAGEDVESVTVTGDCIEDQTFAAADDEDDATDGLQFSVVLNDDAAAGDCVLTVTSSFTEESGFADETDTVTIEIPEQNSNETIEVQPDDPATIQPVTENDDPADGDPIADDGDADDNRSFTATGLDNDETYRITLVSCDNVTRNDDGTVSFASNGTEADGDNLADASGTEADIISINGVATDQEEVDEDGPDNIPGNADDGSPQAETYTATPVNGSITFTIDGDSTECVVPVVYLNGAAGETNEEGGSSPRLELDENGVPVEPFGLGGETTFLPEELASGSDFFGEVIFVDEEENFFVINDGGDEVLLRYDENDQFSYFFDDAGDTAFITFAEFEDYLSVGDFVGETDVTGYSQNPAVSNEFEIDTDELNPPTNVEATTADADDDTDDPATTNVNEATAANDVVVTFDPATEGLVAFYSGFLFEDDADAETECETGVPAGTADSDGAEEEIVFENVPEGDYCVVVTATSETGEESENSEAAEVTVDAIQEVEPTIVDAALTFDALPEDEAGTFDEITLVFSEELDPASLTDAQIRATDADGDTILIECNGTADDAGETQATCVLGDGEDADVENDTLEITLDEPAEDRNAGGDGEVLYPLTITLVDGLTDLDDGAEVDVAGSEDVVVEDEA